MKLKVFHVRPERVKSVISKIEEQNLYKRKLGQSPLVAVDARVDENMPSEGIDSELIWISETPRKGTDVKELARIMKRNMLTILYADFFSGVRSGISRKIIYKYLPLILEEIHGGKIVHGSISSLSFNYFGFETTEIDMKGLEMELGHEGFELQKSVIEYATRNSEGSECFVFFKAPRYLVSYIKDFFEREGVSGVRWVKEKKGAVEVLKLYVVYGYDSDSLSEAIYSNKGVC
jgi:hypothetical protein